GGGTPHTRNDSSSQGFAPATPHLPEEQSEEKLRGVQPPTGCLQIEQHLRTVAQFQMDCPSLVESDHCRRRKRLLLQTVASGAIRQGTLRATQVCERQVCRRRPRSRPRRCPVHWRARSDEKPCV